MTSTRFRSALAVAVLAALVVAAILAVATAPGASAVLREPSPVTSVVNPNAPALPVSDSGR